ncbi:hypothetical protein B0H14DRAFT_2764498 [Mycena olivaceomarginata]|nr:hypothetical protein B0H14DRAFT_2764498 [Mycena olivaceomarginata]
MSSPFASLLGTNYCPKDTEVVQIRDFLVDPLLRLKRLDDEIAVMRKALDTITEERDTLRTYVEAHKALISPFRRLPVDIVEAIFLACLPTHRNCVMSAREAPVILGRICRPWRIISQSFPPLWSSLHIVEPRRPYHARAGLYEAKISQRQEVAITWLQRSGTCPLSISLVDDNIDAIPGSLMNLLIPFAPRWQEITLSVPSLTLKTLSCLTENDVPLLKDLAIAQRLERGNGSALLSLSPVLHAPSLSRFSLSGSNIHYSYLPLQLSHLTALTLVGAEQWGAENVAQSCQIFLEIFYQCSQLRTCTLRVHERPGEYLQDSVVECPFLHTLNLFCTSSVLYTAGRLLSRLSVPVLQDFEIYGDWRTDRSEAYNASGGDSLWAILATCARLKFIATDNATFSKYRWMDFLRNLPPTIQRFRIVPSGHIFEASPDPILPVLEELTVDDGHFVVSDEVLLRFIVSRIPTLRRVDIAVSRERQVDILPTLQPFVEAGLKISVTYSTPSPLPFSPWQGLPEAQY